MFRGMGQPGPRTYIQASETEGSNLWLPIKLAIAGALAIDLLLLLPFLGLMMFGQWMLPIVACIAGLSVYVALRLFTSLYYVNPYKFWSIAFAFGVTALAVGFGERERWWAWVYAGLGGLWYAIIQLLSPYSWWFPLMLVLLWVYGAIRGHGQVAAVFNTVLVGVWGLAWFTVEPIRLGWFAFGQPWTWVHLGLFWDRARWLVGILLGWPWVLFAGVLAIRFIVEIWSGNTLPMQLMPADFKDVTFWDILFPGLFKKQPAPVARLPSRQWVQSAREGENGRAQMVASSIPLPSRHVEQGHIGYIRLLRDLVSGMTQLSWKGNVGQAQYGYKQGEYRGETKDNVVYYGMRQAFENLGYGHTTEDKKWIWHEPFYGYAVPMIVEEFGLDVVPEKYRKYA